MIARTPRPPYYAVIFTSLMTENTKGYEETSNVMLKEAAKIDGYLGIESARNTVGITVSYWRDLAAIATWKSHVDHQLAQQLGKSTWYAQYKVRISRVERDYDFAPNLSQNQP